MEECKKLIELAKINRQKDIKRGTPKYLDNNWLLEAIKKEVDEVKKEIKEANLPKLEDELCDILWGWMMLVEGLHSQNLVRSHEAILNRAVKKYSERILPLLGKKDEDEKIWESIKKRQLKELEKEQSKLK